MFFLLLRLSPWLVAGVCALASWWQWKAPHLYPWPLVAAVAVYILMSVLLVGRSRHWKEGARSLLPTGIALALMAFGHLLIEQSNLRLLTTFLFAAIPWLALELGWFMLYASSQYPAHAFARLNVALIPISIWYVISTLQGIHVFLPTLPAILVGGCVVTTVVLFSGTVRSWEDKRERRWIWASALIGGHLAALLLLLPVGMAIQGAMMAILIAIPIRLRHLSLEHGFPTWSLAIEGVLVCAAWVSLLFMARWG